MKYDPALLESTKSEIIKLLSVIEDMQNGNEEDYACKKNDMRPQKFKSILAACMEKRNMIINYTPEEWIYELLFESVSYASYPSDLDQTIPYCMEKYLDDQEKDLLKRIYWNNETYEAVSIAYNTNSSNIKKIARNALKKLKTEPLPAKAGRFGVLLKQPKACTLEVILFPLLFNLSQSYQSYSSPVDLDSEYTL